MSPARNSARRIGAVSYLNTKPLVYRLAEFAPDCELVFDLPSRLADRLAAGDLDVALIPSVEYLQNPTYQIVSDACIGCRGPVLSVRLLSRTPINRIRTLALDEGSRTSAALVQILLAQGHGVSPQLKPLPIGDDLADIDADALLVIGDRAIHPPEGEYLEDWDLGEQWRRWSGLPFVFAMWVARNDVETSGLDDALRRARDAGVAHLEEIARHECDAVKLSYERCLSYFRDNLYFHLGPQQQLGLDLFFKHVTELLTFALPMNQGDQREPGIPCWGARR